MTQDAAGTTPVAPSEFIQCPKCGQLNRDDEINCTGCGFFLQGPPPASNDAALRMVLPIGVSGLAIVAGYLGLISVLGIPAPFALLTGILAIRDIKRHPGKHGMGRAIFGIIMGGLFTLMLLLMFVGLVLGLALG
jgi:hypothetical protein